ncbi:MAG: nodulation protein NodH [Pseudomonadota bacterium]
MGRFDYFVVLAGMRTGSNLLEEHLNAVEDIQCHGELFNPHFVGHPKQDTFEGVSIARRDKDPLALLPRLSASKDSLGGFRLFEDHDQRVVTHCLADPRCAKIVLRRNPVESFVSLQIAKSTGQWWLGDVTARKAAKAHFDKAEFEDFLADRQGFYGRINHALQTGGQTAFYLDYTDLAAPGVIAGLARFLGAKGTPDPAKIRARVQNPASLSEKVANYDEMVAALDGLDHFDLGRIPNFEPARGPGLPGFLVSDPLGVMFMPLRGGANEPIRHWMGAAGGQAPEDGLKGRYLRRWKRQRPGHRSFTCVTHPLRRAHDAFEKRILATGEGAYLEIRAALRARYGLPIPEDAPDSAWTDADHGRAFVAFLDFLKGNLSGQTTLRVDPDWASQAGLLQSLAAVMVPDRVFRDAELSKELPTLLPDPTKAPALEEPDPGRLAAIYDKSLETAARAAYPKDYMMFGFGSWA